MLRSGIIEQGLGWVGGRVGDDVVRGGVVIADVTKVYLLGGGIGD
jgi:hypothetical protein